MDLLAFQFNAVKKLGKNETNETVTRSLDTSIIIIFTVCHAKFLTDISLQNFEEIAVCCMDGCTKNHDQIN